MKPAPTLLSVALLLAAVVVSTAYGQETTTFVEGRVVNASPDGARVEKLVVTLHQVEADGRREFEATTNAEGRFRFGGIRYDPETAYGVSVTYQDAFYGMDVDLSEWPPGEFDLIVYDSGSDDSALSVSSASVLFVGVDPETGMISAMEIVSLVNSGDHTYVPGPEPMDLLRFGLPSGARGLRVETSLIGADHIQVDRGFALIAGVPPGSHELMYAYEFPYSGATAPFERSVRYGAERLRVMTPEDAMGLAGESLGDAQTVTIGETRYRLLEVTDLPPGTPISVTLSDLPRPGGDSGRWEEVRFEYAAPVSLGLLMVMLIGYALRRHRMRKDAYI